MRPWRTGWSLDRGVNFSLARAAAPEIKPSPARADLVPAEPVCFIDEDRDPPTDAAAVQAYAGSTAAEATLEPPTEEIVEAPGLRAWWSLAGKPSRT